MKTINKIYLLSLMVLIAIMGGCSEDKYELPEPSPALPAGTIGAYFPSTNVKVHELEPSEATEIEMTIARLVTDSAIDVPLVVLENTDDVFKVPATVSFASGAEEATFKVTFPDAGESKTYKLKLGLEGDQYVNPYGNVTPYVSTEVTRIAWEKIEKPMVYIDGALMTVWNTYHVPVYVYAEKAETSDMIKYRFRNIYNSVPSKDADEDGIWDGFPFNDSGDIDAANDYVTLLEIDKQTKEVFMEAHDLGIDWGYGMMSAGSIYGNLSSNKDSYPLGKLVGNKIEFGEASLFFSMAEYRDGGQLIANNSTLIYLTKDAYIEDNLKIEDFNELDYKAITGAVSEFDSEAFDEGWNQTLYAAIDLDEDNDDSDYKNLFYLNDLYSLNHGLAFYLEDGKITIPAGQPTGVTVFGKPMYMSQSDELRTGYEVNESDLHTYSFGLKFHYEDGTILGDFNEVFYYSVDPVSFDIDHFVGTFNVVGQSVFKDEPPADMKNVKIAKGEEENSLIITGIDLADKIEAKFNPETSEMVITPPQKLGNFNQYDITFITFVLPGAPSYTDPLHFTSSLSGHHSVSATSPAVGYILESQLAGGFVYGYAFIDFVRVKGKAAASVKQPTFTLKNDFASFVEAREAGAKSTHNFKIKSKPGNKTLKTNIDAQAF